MISNEERRRVARALRGGYDVVSDVGGRFWLNGTLFGLDISARSEERIRCGLRHLADLIDPGPRAEEIAVKAYRAAADYIDWELGDTPRVLKLREQAEELEAMAREREPYDSDTTKPAADTTKCDRDTIVALADELDEIARKGKASEGWTAKTTLTISRYTNRIREACGATS